MYETLMHIRSRARVVSSSSFACVYVVHRLPCRVCMCVTSVCSTPKRNDRTQAAERGMGAGKKSKCTRIHDMT